MLEDVVERLKVAILVVEQDLLAHPRRQRGLRAEEPEQ